MGVGSCWNQRSVSGVVTQVPIHSLPFFPGRANSLELARQLTLSDWSAHVSLLPRAGILACTSTSGFFRCFFLEIELSAIFGCQATHGLSHLSSSCGAILKTWNKFRRWHLADQSKSQKIGVGRVYLSLVPVSLL